MQIADLNGFETSSTLK